VENVLRLRIGRLGALGNRHAVKDVRDALHDSLEGLGATACEGGVSYALGAKPLRYVPPCFLYGSDRIREVHYRSRRIYYASVLGKRNVMNEAATDINPYK